MIKKIILLLSVFTFIQFASAKDIVVKSDCKVNKVGKLDLSVCLVGGKEHEDKFELRIKDGSTSSKYTFNFNPEGTFNDLINVQGFNDNYLGFQYDDSECAVVKILNLKQQKVVASTECLNNEYCKILQFPDKSSACSVTVKCHDGKDGTKKIDLCK